MNNLEETYQHPGITCKHELNISDFETFANELSQKLNLNIEMSYHRSSILYNKTFSKDGIKEKAYLEEKNCSLIPETKYEFVQKDFKFIIYEDFIEISIEITLDYFHLIQLYNENQLLKIEPFKTIFNQLKILDINEIHFFVFDEFRIGQNKNYCWENVISAINKCRNFSIKI